VVLLSFRLYLKVILRYVANGVPVRDPAAFLGGLLLSGHINDIRALVRDGHRLGLGFHLEVLVQVLRLREIP